MREDDRHLPSPPLLSDLMKMMMRQNDKNKQPIQLNARPRRLAAHQPAMDKRRWRRSGFAMLLLLPLVPMISKCFLPSKTIMHLPVYFLLILFIAPLSVLASQNRQQPKQCALPANLGELPDFAQDEIRAVWKDYQPGRKCDKEQLITEDILAVLAMFDKELERQGMKIGSAAGGGGAEQLQQLTTTLSATTTASPTPISIAESEFGRAAAAAGGNGGFYQTTRSTPNWPENPTPFAPPTLPKSPPQVSPDESGKANGNAVGGRSRQVLGPIAGHRTTTTTQLPTEEDEQEEEYDQQEQQQEKKQNQETDEPTADEPKRLVKQRVLHEYEDVGAGGTDDLQQQQQADGNNEEKEPAQLFEQASSLPFLRGASPGVVRVFRQVLEDPQVPSEQRRMEEIHLLAVSYLNARQLAKFNAWSTERRKRLHFREHRPQLSRPAREALERLARGGNNDVQRMQSQLKHLPSRLRGKLHKFALLNSRRTLGPH